MAIGKNKNSVLEFFGNIPSNIKKNFSYWSPNKAIASKEDLAYGKGAIWFMTFLLVIFFGLGGAMFLGGLLALITWGSNISILFILFLVFGILMVILGVVVVIFLRNIKNRVNHYIVKSTVKGDDK
jgi:hypothetical protein